MYPRSIRNVSQSETKVQKIIILKNSWSNYFKKFHIMASSYSLLVPLKAFSMVLNSWKVDRGQPSTNCSLKKNALLATGVVERAIQKVTQRNQK